MKQLIGMMMLVLGVTGALMAGAQYRVPEIDPGSGMSALAMVSGAMLLYRGRRK